MRGWDVGAAVTVAVLVATVAYSVGMQPAERTMKATGRIGIVGMEFLRTRERARVALRRWGAEGRRAAQVTLWWDYLFIVAYVFGSMVLARAVALHALDGRGWPGWSDVAWFGGGWAVALAGLCDAVENTALLFLTRRESVPDGGVNLPLVAAVAATIKFALLLVALLVVVTVALLFHAAR